MEIEQDSEIDKKKQNIYLIVRSLKGIDGKSQKGYALNPGDIIKLGRVEYQVTEFTYQNPETKKFEIKKVDG